LIIFLQATVEGLSLAAIYSLVAIGFVLIYKAMEVLSFAQPALAVVGAGIISSLAIDRGIPFWLALFLGVILTGILGLLIERTFLRPMVGEPVFSVAVLTIGIGLIGLLVASLIPNLERFKVQLRFGLGIVVSMMLIGYFVTNHDLHYISEDYLGVITKLAEIGLLHQLLTNVDTHES